MMLPKMVAATLIRGEPFEAEAYDCVSIYFSDICGMSLQLLLLTHVLC